MPDVSSWVKPIVRRGKISLGIRESPSDFFVKAAQERFRIQDKSKAPSKCLDALVADHRHRDLYGASFVRDPGLFHEIPKLNLGLGLPTRMERVSLHPEFAIHTFTPKFSTSAATPKRNLVLSHKYHGGGLGHTSSHLRHHRPSHMSGVWAVMLLAATAKLGWGTAPHCASDVHLPFLGSVISSPRNLSRYPS